MWKQRVLVQLLCLQSITAGVPGTYTLRADATDGNATVSDEIQFLVKEDVVNEIRPAGLNRGVNIIDDQTVYFCAVCTL